MKLIDVHVHLFPEDIVDEYMENYTSHSKLAAVCRPTVDRLLEEYRGVDAVKFVILPEWESTREFESDNIRLAAASDMFYTKCFFYYYNRWLGSIQRNDGRLVCFGGVHPDDPDSLREYERIMGTYGLQGLKLVPCMQHFRLNDRRLYPVYERAEAEGKPILVHTGGDPVPGTEIFGHPRDVDDVAAAFPGLRIIMAHMGIPFFEETKAVMKQHENVYTDIAFTVAYEDVRAFSLRHGMEVPFLTKEFWRNALASLITDIGHERILFGSDFPFIKPSVAMESFMELDLSDEAKEMILWKNAYVLLS